MFGCLFAAEEDEEYFDGEEEEAEEDVAPERAVTGKRGGTANPTSPGPSTFGGALGVWTPPSTPPSSPPGSSPVAAATLPAQEKRRGRRMSGDGTRDRVGDKHTRRGGRWPREPAPAPAGDTFLYGCKQDNSARFVFCLLLYIIVTDLNFVYFVKKTGVLSGFFSLASRFQLASPVMGGGDAGGFARPVPSPVSWLGGQRGREMPPGTTLDFWPH